MNYSEILETITSLTGKKTSLEAVEKMAKLLGSPEKKLRAIHVAGTNGKGSVCLKIASSLGSRCGLFTSPHLFCFRERIQIGGQKISEEAVVALINPIFEIAKKEGIALSFFEISTLLAFCYFEKEKVDYAVIEVGLGGRLDATNIISPILSVITSIGLDHCELLGDSIEKIAREKGGIIKKGVPVVIGPQVPRSVIEPIANSFSAPLTQVEGVFSHYGEENKAIAKACLVQLSIFEVFEIEPRCRFEKKDYKGRVVILDVAHNPQGIERLIERLKFTYPDQAYHFIFAMSGSKDIAACAKLIGAAATSVQILACDHPRLAPAEELKAYFPMGGSIEECLHNQKEGIIVICGSFFLFESVFLFLTIIEKEAPRCSFECASSR